MREHTQEYTEDIYKKGFEENLKDKIISWFMVAIIMAIIVLFVLIVVVIVAVVKGVEGLHV